MTRSAFRGFRLHSLRLEPHFLRRKRLEAVFQERRIVAESVIARRRVDETGVGADVISLHFQVGARLLLDGRALPLAFFVNVPSPADANVSGDDVPFRRFRRLPFVEDRRKLRIARRIGRLVELDSGNRPLLLRLFMLWSANVVIKKLLVLTELFLLSRKVWEVSLIRYLEKSFWNVDRNLRSCI